MASHLDPQAVAMGQAVRGAIAQAGLTLAEAAHAADMAHNTLSRRVNGNLPFTWPEIVRIAEVTDVSCTDLVTNAVRIADRPMRAAV